MKRERIRLAVEVDLDPVPGWGNEAEHWRETVQRTLNDIAGHYNPTVTITPGPVRMKLLDLYCCQGGASMGYHQAGFTPYGVDIKPQPRYPFPFHQGDVLEVLVTLLSGGAVDFIHPDGTVEWLTLAGFIGAHASPPCQARTKAQKIQGREHPRLIGPTRELLEQTGLPYVIENVVPEEPEADPDPLVDPVLLCGAMFQGLRTYRHRLFEANFPIEVPAHPEHAARLTKMGRPPVDGEFMHVVGHFSGVSQAKAAMGIDWMTRDGLREAIPPAFSKWIGMQLGVYLYLPTDAPYREAVSG